MEASSPRRILVVADLTPATPRLLDLVGQRAREQACEFSLLVPNVGHPDAPDWTVEEAKRLLEEHARAPVEVRAGGVDALASVERCVADSTVDEIIVSTLPEHRAHWFHHDLPSRLQHLGIPVTDVPGVEEDAGGGAGFGGITLP
jgi:hypothetical protein